MENTRAPVNGTLPYDNARYPKSHRLRTAPEFRLVFDGATRSGDRALTLLARPNSVGFARLGMAIARKKTRTAVARNRLKRVIRESFRVNQPELPAIDIVVLLRDGAVGRSNRELLTELDRHWRRLSDRMGKPVPA